MPLLGKRSAKNESSHRGNHKFRFKPGQQYVYHHKDDILNFYDKDVNGGSSSNSSNNELDLFESHESPPPPSLEEDRLPLDRPDNKSLEMNPVDIFELDNSISEFKNAFDMDQSYLEPSLLHMTEMDDNDSALLRLQEEMETFSSQSDLFDYSSKPVNVVQGASLTTNTSLVDPITIAPSKLSIPSFNAGHRPFYASWSLYYGEKEMTKIEHFWCCVCDLFCESILLENNKLDENQIFRDYYYVLDLYLFEKFLGSIEIQSIESFEMPEYCSDITSTLKCFAVSLTEMLFRQQVQEMQLVRRAAQDIEQSAPVEIPRLEILLSNSKDCSFLVSKLTDPRLLKSNFLGNLICMPIQYENITIPLHLQITITSSTWKCSQGCGQTTTINHDISMRRTSGSSDAIDISPASIKGIACRLCGKKTGLELQSPLCDSKLFYSMAVRPTVDCQEVTFRMSSIIASQILNIPRKSFSQPYEFYWIGIVKEKNEISTGSTKKRTGGLNISNNPTHEPYSLVLDVLQVSGPEKTKVIHSSILTQPKKRSSSHVFEKIVCSFAKSLIGRDLYKAALILWMACPIKLKLLLCGDPSTGKTTLLKSCQAIMPFNQSNPINQNSGTSTNNLDKISNICAVEGVHQWKSIKIAQALARAKTSVIMTATPLQGHFNYAKSIDENFGWHESGTTSSLGCSANFRLFDINLFFKDDPEANRHGDRLLAEYLLSTKGSTSMAASSTTESNRYKTNTDRLDPTITATNPKVPSQTLLQRIMKLQATNSFFYDHTELQNVLFQAQQLAISQDFQQIPDENVKNMWEQGAMADLRRYRLISGFSIGRACIEGRTKIIESDVLDVLEIIQFIDEQKPQHTGKGADLSGKGKSVTGKASTGRGKSSQWKIFAASLDKGSILTSCQLRSIAQESGLEHLLDNWPSCVEALNQQGIIIKVSPDAYRVT